MPANTTAGTQTWTGSAYGSCTASACSASYHLESGVCVSNTRTCSPMPANATAGTQTWTGSAYGSCTVTTCATNFHLESGACVSNTRTCSPMPTGTTAGTQTWTGSAYGSCTASACSSTYWLSGTTCVLKSALGAACTLSAACTSGYCATGPTAPANDRCAPPNMNYIPAGTFSMGSPTGELGRTTDGTRDEAQHTVTLSRAFFLGQTEVTQGQWVAAGASNPSCFRAATGVACTGPNANPNGPVEYIDWYSAAGFANAKSAAEGLTSCYTLTGCADAANGWKDGTHTSCSGATFAGLSCTGYRLPTESEWEYAARAGSTTATYLGNLTSASSCTTTQTSLDSIAWWCRNGGSRTQAVGSKTANSFGLFDMLGNVSEWTGDGQSTYPGTVTDPTGGADGFYRMYRGGWFSSTPDAVRSARRNYASSFSKGEYIGFRIARTVP
jgi:formylglycine-generating enzyme required for sulfatase activity